jgi:hypothetical protein
MRTLPVLVMLLVLVPFSYADALDDVPTLDLNEGTIDFTTPDVNEGAIGNHDDVTTPDINEGASTYRDDIATPDINEAATDRSRILDRRLGR